MITVVTAFFDIGRGNWVGVANGHEMPAFLQRTTDTYFERFTRLAKLQNPLVVHTTGDYRDRVLAIREECAPGVATTVVVHDDFFTSEVNASLLAGIESAMAPTSSFALNPAMPEYWNARYVLLNIHKAWFVTQSLMKGRVDSQASVAWIDFGYCRDDHRFPPGFSWKHDFGDKINLFNIRSLDDRPLVDLIRTGDVYIQGCHIVAPGHRWDMLWELVQTVTHDMLGDRLIDDDQTILLGAYRAKPSEFHVNFVDDRKDGWFVVFKEWP